MRPLCLCSRAYVCTYPVLSRRARCDVVGKGMFPAKICVGRIGMRLSKHRHVCALRLSCAPCVHRGSKCCDSASNRGGHYRRKFNMRRHGDRPRVSMPSTFMRWASASRLVRLGGLALQSGQHAPRYHGRARTCRRHAELAYSAKRLARSRTGRYGDHHQAKFRLSARRHRCGNPQRQG